MNLSDHEILELAELCSRLEDNRLTDAQRDRLAQLLSASEAARRYYVRALGQSASLQAYAAETHADAPAPRSRPMHTRVLVRRFSLSALAAAACVALAFLWPRNWFNPSQANAARAEFVARITGEKDARWSPSAGSMARGAHLRRGQRIELDAGYAEITFDSGARVVLEGSASLEIASAWDATLRRGKLKADVPPQAVGFRVANRFVDVIDLGTEFTMIADGDRGAEVLVNKGEVEASPRSSGELEPVLLREHEARRFGATGISDVEDVARKLLLFTDDLELERYNPRAGFAHWTFDELSGSARRSGPRPAAQSGDLQLLGGSESAPDNSRTAGRWQRALHFDGQRYANATFPGISGTMARTVAFWVKVSPEAQPADTWMVAWGTELPKLGHRPVHIGWNRRPSEGALGALRTDFGGGHAIGTTTLRDGQWHHIAVIFTPGDDLHSLVQVKQYVDGRLESSTIVRGTLSTRAGTGDATLTDTVWLGYRLTGTRQEGRRFRGDLDELFIVNRPLQPQEIVSLLETNRLPEAAFAAAP